MENKYIYYTNKNLLSALVYYQNKYDTIIASVDYEWYLCHKDIKEQMLANHKANMARLNKLASIEKRLDDLNLKYIEENIDLIKQEIANRNLSLSLKV